MIITETCFYYFVTSIQSVNDKSISYYTALVLSVLSLDAERV